MKEIKLTNKEIAMMKTYSDEQKGYKDRKAGYYDKWYRYNRANDGAEYDKGVRRAAEGKCPEYFTLIEAYEGNRS
jgi:hypothetical protein